MDIYEKELVTEIAKIMQKKYMHMNETLRLTKEMAEGLTRDDKVTTQMLLEMRGEELEAMGGCDKNIHLLLEGAEESVGMKLLNLLRGESSDELSGEVLAESLKTILQNTKHVLEQTIEIDKRMSCRLAGEDSFYNE